jgi:hypothetical protein
MIVLLIHMLGSQQVLMVQTLVLEFQMVVQEEMRSMVVMHCEFPVQEQLLVLQHPMILQSPQPCLSNPNLSITPDE